MNERDVTSPICLPSRIRQLTGALLFGEVFGAASVLTIKHLGGLEVVTNAIIKTAIDLGIVVGFGLLASVIAVSISKYLARRQLKAEAQALDKDLSDNWIKDIRYTGVRHANPEFKALTGPGPEPEFYIVNFDYTIPRPMDNLLSAPRTLPANEPPSGCQRLTG